jgi:putative hydrolase of the HAD superfamily
VRTRYRAPHSRNVRRNEMKTLIFDMDDTLIVEEASAQAAFLAACRFANEKVGVDTRALCNSIRESCRTLWHGSPARPYCLDVGISSWEGLWACFTGDDENLRTLAAWAPTYRRNSWQDALRRCGHEDDDVFAEELADRYVQERRKLHVVYDDVVPVLEHLRNHHRIGLLTNGAPDLQRRKLAESGLAGYFNAVVVSGEVGFGKPDPRIFRLMLDTLNASAEASAMIGNSLKSDVAPAAAIGMMTVWVNREHKAGSEATLPDAEVAGLTELIEIFGR